MEPARARFVRYLITLIAVLAMTVVLTRAGVFAAAFTALGNAGLAAAVIAGFFFVSIFTVAPAGVALYTLAGEYDPYLVAVLGAVGAVAGDYLLYHFFRDSLFQNIKEAFHLDGRFRIEHVFHSQRFHWFFVLIGAIIIASPIPDEAGLALLGVSNLPARKFVLLAFILDFFGIILITLAGAR